MMLTDYLEIEKETNNYQDIIALKTNYLGILDASRKSYADTIISPKAERVKAWHRLSASIIQG